MKLTTQRPKRPPLDQSPLKSMKELAFLLGEERETLLRLAEWEPHYAPFQLAKPRKPHTKKIEPAKLRDIDNPTTELKNVQTKILKRLLLPVKLPDFVFGAVPKRCVGMHAKVHLGATTVVKMDIKNYYPNVTNAHIYKVWADVLNCSPPVASLLTKLTTCNFHLPQGAPTSPALANLFLTSIYGPILLACIEKSVAVTVWVDDLTFSGNAAREMMGVVRATLAAHGLKDSRKKRKILGPGKTKVVTGVRLGAKELRACKLKVREVRAGIHNLKLGRLTSRGSAKDIQGLQGQIAYIRSICPADAAPLESGLADALHDTTTAVSH